MAKASREFLYGLNACFECLRANRRRVYEGLLNEASRSAPRMRKLAGLLEARNVPVRWLDRGQLHQLCGSREHQGAVLKAETYVYTPFDTAGAERPQRLLLLDNVEDPHNVGAILRSAEVFGFQTVLLPLKGVPEVYPSVVKVSAGAAEHLNIVRDRAANRYVQQVQEWGYRVVALDAKGSEPLVTFAKAAPEHLLLVIGGEDKSVGQFILNTAEAVVRVEQAGQINSLNASVAASIAMFALTLAR